MLDPDFGNSFFCPVCGPTPNTVVCDGTIFGFRKDLLTARFLLDSLEAISDIPPLKGSEHMDKVLIQNPKARELLLKFSGVSCDRNLKPLTQRDFTCLLVIGCLKSFTNPASRLRSLVKLQIICAQNPIELFCRSFHITCPARRKQTRLLAVTSAGLKIQYCTCHNQLPLL